jgi:hypothetical protein
VSIAVMNWVWAHSPTSGNERLVLLALADACSRDDGTGCWPSAATIARKASISVRTVRRVIARLGAEGYVLVHRGGGRLSTGELPSRPGQRRARPPWCGGCDERTRRREDAGGGDTGRCPVCHPLAAGARAAGVPELVTGGKSAGTVPRSPGAGGAAPERSPLASAGRLPGVRGWVVGPGAYEETRVAVREGVR